VLPIFRGDEQLERGDETAGGKEHVLYAEESRLGRGNKDCLAGDMVINSTVMVDTPGIRTDVLVEAVVQEV